jgi:hypothetical protein
MWLQQDRFFGYSTGIYSLHSGTSLATSVLGRPKLQVPPEGTTETQQQQCQLGVEAVTSRQSAKSRPKACPRRPRSRPLCSLQVAILPPAHRHSARRRRPAPIPAGCSRAALLAHHLGHTPQLNNTPLTLTNTSQLEGMCGTSAPREPESAPPAQQGRRPAPRSAPATRARSRPRLRLQHRAPHVTSVAQKSNRRRARSAT